MKMNIKTLAIAAVSAVALAACSTPATESTDTAEAAAETMAEATTPNIVALAASQDNLTTLVAAVKAAGLVKTLSGEGPFTVFAPTDAAFGKLPAGTVETLVKPENKDALTGILTYHVVAGEVKAADVIALITSSGGTASVPTVGGGTLSASIVDGKVVLTDAKGGTSTVTATDVAASNGVVHLIDTVVMPAG